MSPVVDTHTHWMVPSDAFPEMRGSGAPPPSRAGRNIVATQDGVSIIVYEDFYNLEKANAVSDEAGVTQRLLSASMMLELYGRMLDLPSLEIAKRINDQGAALMKHYPEVVAMATVSPFDQDHLDEADRCLDELGMKGIFVETSSNGTFLDDPATYPFWEYVEDRGVAVFLHPPMLPIGHQSMRQYKLEETVGRPFDTTMCIARMIYSGLFDRFPGLKILAAHMGGGLMAVMGRLEFAYRLGYEGLPPEAAAKNRRRPSEYLRENLWVDTMGFWAPYVREVLEVFGADRVLLGTDYGPVPISPKEHIDLVRSLGLGDEDEEKVLWKNADALFGLGLGTTTYC